MKVYSFVAYGNTVLFEANIKMEDYEVIQNIVQSIKFDKGYSTPQGELFEKLKSEVYNKTKIILNPVRIQYVFRNQN